MLDSPPRSGGCDMRVLFVSDTHIEAHARVAAAIESTPHDAVVHLRVAGAMPATLTAAALRAMAGVRTVTLGVRRRPTSSGPWPVRTIGGPVALAPLLTARRGASR